MTVPLSHDEIAELLGAYALDAVDQHERDVVDAHLVSCARCRAEVQEHREVATLLAFSGEAAPDGLWQRIAASLDEPPPQLRLAPVEEGPARRRGMSRWAPRLAAAAAVALLVGLGLQVRDQDDRIEDLQVALQDPLERAFLAAVRDPASEVVDLASVDGATEARAAVTPDGRGYLHAADLPPLAAGRTYQLWGLRGAEAVSLGVLGPDPALIPFSGGDDYDALAITEEASPGVAAPTRPPVVTGELS